MLKVRQLSFSYGQQLVLDDISFEVQPGENVALIGESGSGKTSLLKLIYGEFDLNAGEIFWKDSQILGPKNNLVVGYDFMKTVSQEFDLMPFTSIKENIGKHLSNFFPERKTERVAELLEVVELTEFSNQKVKTLSGGQKQRVAIARALALQPEILLLDEPFSHIDNFRKDSLRRKLFNHLKKENISCIVATHDKNDVLGYADKMIVLHDRKIIANDKVESLYNNPKSLQIASFFGTMNEIDGYGIVYAHQIEVVNKSDLQVNIKQSYFQGTHYLIEADYNGRAIFFEHYEGLENGNQVFLKVKK